MAKIKRYHRKQTIPEYGGVYFFDCVRCGGVGEVFALEADVHAGRNKYINAGLCPACFEIGVASSVEEMAFDTALSGLPSHEDFCSGKIKVLAYMKFENGVQNYLWSDKESDGEISESDLIEMGDKHGLKIERLAIFKLHKVFDRTDEGGEGKDEGA